MCRCQRAPSSCCATIGARIAIPCGSFRPRPARACPCRPPRSRWMRAVSNAPSKPRCKKAACRKTPACTRLRHSYATHLLEAGVNLAAHSSLSRSQFAQDHRALYPPDARSERAGHRRDQSGDAAPAVIELADIFRTYGPAYRAKFGDKIPPQHLRAMRAIERCRTPALGGHVYTCPDCGETLYRYHSCRNRHCPKCQHENAQRWLEQQYELQLPVPYFMLTFTLPSQLRPFARSHQKLVYDVLFRASAEAAQQLARDPRFVGGTLGLVGVLHTWARDLSYHPHVHYLVPAGGSGRRRTDLVARRAKISCSRSRRSPSSFAPSSATPCARPMASRTSPLQCGSKTGSCIASPSAMAAPPQVSRPLHLSRRPQQPPHRQGRE